MSTRLIVKNVPAAADEKRLRAHFGDQGDITDVKVQRKKDGRSRGFAFVGFKTAEQAAKAQQYFDRSFLGACKLSVSFAESYKAMSYNVKGVSPTSKHDQRKLADDNATAQDGRATKLAEFLGLLKPQSKSQTFVNESSQAVAAVPVPVLDIGGDVELTEARSEDTSASPVDAEIDPLVVDDDISDMEYLKSRMRSMQNAGAEPRSTTNDAPEAESPALHEVNVAPVIQDSVTIIRETGRLFCRNLAFSATDAEVRTLMEEHGSLTECRILRSHSGISKGIAFVRFTSPADAVSAFEVLDGTIFQGRLLHLLPGKLIKSDAAQDQIEGAQDQPFKAAREKERKANAANRTTWSTFYMRDDTIAEAVADLLGIAKAELLDPLAPDAAVRMALGETQVLAATKQDLAAGGVNVAALEAAAQQSGHASQKSKICRSKTVLLLKNLPFEATEDSIQELFDRGGGCVRVVLPRTRALALVELQDEQTARNAFKHLAYKRFHHVPLYVEFAPDAVLDKPPAPREAEAPSQAPLANDAQDGLDFFEPGETHGSSTLFIKGLSFGTTQASLQKRCAKAAAAVGGILRSVTIPTKKNALCKDLMQGYAFAEFSNHDTAKSVMHRMNGTSIEGHSVVVELSQTGGKGSARGIKKRDRESRSETKIMVRNLAFEATAKDVRQLMEAFGHVKTCRLPKKFDGSTRGFAFVEFATKGEAQTAVRSAHGTHLYGRRLLLEYAAGDEGLDELRAKVAKGHTPTR